MTTEGTTLNPCALLLREHKHLPHVLKKGGGGEEVMDRPGLHLLFTAERCRKPEKGLFSVRPAAWFPCRAKAGRMASFLRYPPLATSREQSSEGGPRENCRLAVPCPPAAQLTLMPVFWTRE